MLSASNLKLIEQQIANENMAEKPRRTFMTEIDGVKMLIKVQEENKPKWRTVMLRTFSILFREPLLKPTLVPGASNTQAMELMRLKNLAAAGVSVPQVLHEEKNWFALSYLPGSNLRELYFQDKNADQRFYFEQALAGILDTHQKGQSLSQAFNRNIMWCEDKIVFIDFEDEPSTYLGMTAAQARDWLYFLFSSVWQQKQSIEEVTDIVWKYVQQDAPDVQKALLHTGSSIGWLRHLPTERKKWGRDVIALQLWGQLLVGLKKRGEASVS